MGNITERKKNILIAGADGLIGKYFCSAYNKNYSITSLAYYDKNNRYSFSGNLSEKPICDKIAQECIKPDVLVFFIGLAHAKGKGKDILEFERVNFQTLVNLLTALEKYNKTPGKIIFASTISVYGERYNQIRYNEELVPDPFSPYAATKLKAEQYLLDNWKNKSWILRFAPVYSANFFLNINRRTKIGERFYKIGNGSMKLSLCNIKNIKMAIEGIIDGKVPAGVYNISDPKPYTYNDLLNQQVASGVFRIPAMAIRLLYVLGKMTNNIFIKENSIKLITDNIFPADKIRSYVNLSATIDDIKIVHD